MAEKAQKAIPEGMHTISIHLWFNGNCNEAIEFYQKAFGAELVAPVVPTPDGDGVLHAMLRLGDSPLLMADSWPGSWESGPKQNTTASMWIYVEDCDKLFNRAVEAGCQSKVSMNDAFWGDRFGKVQDPFGHVWSIATHKWVYSSEEMQRKQKEWEDKLREN